MPYDSVVYIYSVISYGIYPVFEAYLALRLSRRMLYSSGQGKLRKL